MTRSVIVGSGHYIPENIVSTEELMASQKFYNHKNEEVTFTREDVKESVGVDQRPIELTDVVEMGAKALQDCIAHTRINPDDISHVFVATNTGEKIANVGSRVSRRAGLKHAFSPEIVYGCQGGLTTLDVVDSHIVAGKIKPDKYVAVVATEQLSSVKGSSKGDLLFSDGAAVMILKPLETYAQTGILGSYTIADNDFTDAITMRDNTTPVGPKRVMVMNGKEVYKKASQVFYDAYYGLLREANLTDKDIKVNFTHQASWKIVFAVASKIFETEYPEMKKEFPSVKQFDPLVLEYMNKKMPYSVDFLGNNSVVTTLMMFDLVLNPPKEYNPKLEGLMKRMLQYEIKPNDLITFNAAGAGMADVALLVKMHQLYWDYRK